MPHNTQKNRNIKKAAQWKTDAFDHFEAMRGYDARKYSRFGLKKIFQNCRGIPAFDEAVSWALANNIRFFIDFECTSAIAYYTSEHGVIGLSHGLVQQSVRDAGEVAGHVTHEIRHAWQDAQGLIQNYTVDFSGFYIRQALIEADANAWGELARAQSRLKLRQAFTFAAGSAAERDMAERERLLLGTGIAETLWHSFKDWYVKPHIKRTYGDIYANYLGHAMGLPDFRHPHADSQFKGERSEPVPGIVLDRIEDVLPLGKMFNGGNYLAEAQSRDLILRRYLSPTHALCMFLNKPGTPNKRNMQVQLEMMKRRRQTPGFHISF